MAVKRYLHHEDSEGACTIREYIEVTGTENAYDSGRVGRSMRTASMALVQRSIVRKRNIHIPSSSSSTPVLSSILVNLSHSLWPLSLSKPSGIHARRYVGFAASCYLDESAVKHLGECTNPLHQRDKSGDVVPRVCRGVDVYFRFAVYEPMLSFV